MFPCISRFRTSRSGSPRRAALRHRPRRQGLSFRLGEIAVAAINPHAGKGGPFGRQHIEVSEPTTAKAVADGLNIVGPVSGETVFVKLRAGQYEGVIAM